MGIIKIATASPILKVADVSFNAWEMVKCIREADKAGARVIMFPELSLTGATCGDLFFQDQLYEDNIDGLKELVIASRDVDITIIAGGLYKVNDRLHDCAFVIECGEIEGIIPKMHVIADSGIDYSRWFKDGILASDVDDVWTPFSNEHVSFGDIIFQSEDYKINAMIRIGTDRTCYTHPEDGKEYNDDDTLNIIFNPTADSVQMGIPERNEAILRNFTYEKKSCLFYASPGVHESTTDYVFGGHHLALMSGSLLSENLLFLRDNVITYTEFDTDASKYDSRENPPDLSRLEEFYITPTNRAPLIPKNDKLMSIQCEQAISIQAAGLAKRMEHTQAKKLLIGISGGLDSTLALLVCAEACRILGRDNSDIITVTMPGFGTSKGTFSNAMDLMKLLNTNVREISIDKVIIQHFEDIGHDINNHNKAYENAQARERTQILMDIANDVNGMVVGTGDLSESALGWCTYNGDHMSNYNVNASVPKTLIPHIINHVIDSRYKDNVELAKVLKSVIDTPISPELLPADEDGDIAQKTEDSVGPYELHDYFIYHVVVNGMTPKEILRNASLAFHDSYDKETIKKWLEVFYRRFFSQQFKRNCMPDGPKVTCISLSPRAALDLPSDCAFSFDGFDQL